MKRLLIYATGTAFILLILISLSVTASAASDGTCGDCVTWMLDDDGNLTIGGTGNMYNYSASADVPWNSFRPDIKTVTIGNAVTGISKYSFSNCDNLTSLYVTSIDSYLNIQFDDYTSCPMYYANKLYINNKRAVNIVIPESVSAIPDYAFYRCTSLNSAEISGNVKTIGQYAFSGCTYLTELSINDGVEIIERYAFHECKSLSSVTVPDSVTRINSFAFNGCEKLTDITLPFIGSSSGGSINHYHGGPSDVFGYIFGYYSVNTNVLNNPYAQYDYYIPSALKKVTVTNETVVSPYSFEDCTNLTDISINYGITTIGKGAFYNCSSLKSIVVPDSVNYIYDYVFYNCTSLSDITLPFVGMSRDATDSSAVFGYIFGGQSASFTGGLTQSYYDGYTFCYFIVSSVKRVTITDAREIPYGAFSNCSFLQSITLNEGITEIGKNAFYNCRSLTELVIPDSVTNISEYALQNCGSETVYINCAIPNYMFYTSDIQKIIMGNGVKNIGEKAFYHCDYLDTVVMTKNITEIEAGTFQGCDNIKTVEYSGTADD